MTDIDQILREELPPDADKRIRQTPAQYNASAPLAQISGRAPPPPQLVRNQFRPGASGNPGGRPQMYTFTRALREVSSPRKAKQAAEMAWELAGAGNLKAMELVRDSLEGKPGVRIADGEWNPEASPQFAIMQTFAARFADHSLIVEGPQLAEPSAADDSALDALS